MHFKNKSIYILIALLILSAFSAYAVQYTTKVATINNRITENQLAEFKLTIFNNDPTAQEFKIENVDFPRWFISSVPDLNPILVDIPANSNETITLLIKPNKRGIGTHFVNFNVIAQSTKESLQNQVRVALVNSNEIITGYVPTVTIKTDFPKKVTPDEELSFSITLTNENQLNITGAKLTLSSALLDESIDIDMPPKESKTIDIKKQLDPMTKPMGDSLTISFDYNGKNIDKEVVNYEIVPYSSIEDITEEKSSFLRKSQKIIFTNKANVRFEGDILINTSVMRKAFGTATPDAEITKVGDQMFYLWKVNLAPFESYTITITENYLGILVIFIAIVLAIVFALAKRSPVTVTKEVTESESDADGLLRIKVLINVKNKSPKKLQEISVIDKIPKLLHIDKNTTIGSLKPTKIKRNENNESFILWDIEELTPGEERVINYYLKSHLNILGGLSLQSTIVKFRINGKEAKVKSKTVSIKF